ncbi:hypothetical protein F418_p69 [Hafnia phage Enc34]|uniref:Uncharacterized protein n=1 Tax=Hafnia phage Enc34 TaxID=1150990 RepID=H6WYN1_9CAUD|nr:hypothetical protein F418_p69 [Hafnia phage Enc34]AFB84086.1 hypothetical protein [Hafnia phage Enc34]
MDNKKLAKQAAIELAAQKARGVARAHGFKPSRRASGEPFYTRKDADIYHRGGFWHFESFLFCEGERGAIVQRKKHADLVVLLRSII